MPLTPRLDGSGEAALVRVREQARIQVEGEDHRDTRWELLEPEWTVDPQTGDRRLVPDRGLLVLPEPSPNDLFLDLEGDPFALDDGIDYLFGILDASAIEDDPRWAPADPSAGGGEGRPAPAFHGFWSLDDEGLVTLAAEKAAFERTVDFLVARLDADPTLHVYHYAAYEKTALGRLAQRHATREDEVDRLLRGRVLVDLYRVVRQGIRASVESYSIKRLEPLYGLVREVNLRDAGSSIVQFEAWLGRGATADGLVGNEILREIEGYNRDDVLSTWRLRDWLEARRVDLEGRLGIRLARPTLEDAAIDPPEPTERQAAVAEVMGGLLAPLEGIEPQDRSTDQQATWLLAQLLGWHRRENKAFWWRYYELCGLSDEDLADTREAIGMVALESDLGQVTKAGARLQRFRFPPQDHALKVGRRVDDPHTQKSAGTVVEIDEVGGSVTLRRTAGDLARGTPTSLVPYEFVATTVIEDSLLRIGRRVLERGIASDGPIDRAGRQLLLRRPPRIAGRAPGGPLRGPDEPALAAAKRLVRALDGTTLAIQGPPGTGKTWTGARMILELVAAGKTVGVTATSHKVIGNVLDAVHAAAGSGTELRMGQKPGQDDPPASPHARDLHGWSGERIAAAVAEGELNVVGGTAWLWSAESMQASVDVVLVDEAGQFSLANAVAVSPAAGSLVLLGDPQQLDQPLRGAHPPGAERSALAHLLAGRPGEMDRGEHATMPPELGLFLDRTWRLHPAICAYTSEVFYASRLEPVAGLEQQGIQGGEDAAAMPPGGSGLRWLAVPHAANDTDSPEEAAAIVGLVRNLLGARPRWTNAAGEESSLRLADIVIVAPYNAHVDLVARELARAGFIGARVGTVDKFQGQEAPLSIYAMGSSSADDAPRGMEFLYSLNRLNVATSRARCVALVVASPALVRVACRTPRQMRLANALCRLVEMSR